MWSKDYVSFAQKEELLRDAIGELNQVWDVGCLEWAYAEKTHLRMAIQGADHAVKNCLEKPVIGAAPIEEWKSTHLWALREFKQAKGR